MRSLGLELAKLAKLPSRVLSTAWKVSTALESLAEAGRQRARGTQLARRRRELLRVNIFLLMLRKRTNAAFAQRSRLL